MNIIQTIENTITVMTDGATVLLGYMPVVLSVLFRKHADNFWYIMFWYIIVALAVVAVQRSIKWLTEKIYTDE